MLLPLGWQQLVACKLYRFLYMYCEGFIAYLMNLKNIKNIHYMYAGNHESAPVNMFTAENAPKEMRTSSWLYSYLVGKWRHWGIEDPSVGRLGCYSSIINESSTGLRLRIISLNMNYCNRMDFWNYLNETDPDHVLQWLIQQLQQAEMLAQPVHIIGHIPPGMCMQVC